MTFETNLQLLQNPASSTEQHSVGLADSAIFVAPARFDVHTTDSLVSFATSALADGKHLVLDLRVVDFIDEHITSTIDTLSATAATDNVTCSLVNMSDAAALTFDFLSRASA